MRLIAFAATLLLAFAAGAQEAPVLNIYNWTDYFDDQALAIFTAETGIKVNYDTYDSNETLDAKLRAGKSGYDLVVPTASPFLANQIPAKLYQPIDRSRIPNYRSLDRAIMKQLAAYDPGNRHAVPWMWGTTGIAYNVQKIKAVMPNAPVDSLAMLFDPGIVARFKSCGIVMLDSPTDVLPQALAWLKLNPDSDKPEDLEQATATLLAVRPFIRKFHSSEYVSDLATGDACLAIGFSGDVAQAAKRARGAKNGVEIAYRVPKEGAQMWIDAWAIPAGAPHPGNALRFLDFVLRPEIAAMNSNFIGYANANAEAEPFVDAEILKDPGIYPDAETMARLFTVNPKPQAYERLRTRAWTRVTSGR